MKYVVSLYHTEVGVSVSVPALPGCWSEGDTEAEALENIREPIDLYIDSLRDDGLPVPKDSFQAEVVAV